MLNLDFNNEVVKMAPVAGVVASDATARLVWGLTLNEWVYVATIAYIVVQIGSKAATTIVELIIKYKKESK